ncbi:AXR1 [Symbiodinium microadriaticum]|nr:AXR1 [Symbiodinium microadriaticum]
MSLGYVARPATPFLLACPRCLVRDHALAEGDGTSKRRYGVWSGQAGRLRGARRTFQDARSGLRAQDSSSAFGLESWLFAAASQANEVVNQGLSDGGPFLIPILFMGGLASSLNPCTAASLPAAAASVAALSRRQSPVLQALAYTAGSAVVLVALGVAVAFAGERLPLGEGILPWLFPVVAVVMGLSLLEIIPLKLSGIPGLGETIEAAPRELRGFLLGMASAAGSSPCATPVLVTTTTYLASHSVGMANSALLLFSYAMGYSAPLALVSVSAGFLPIFQETGQWGKSATGVVILLAGSWQLLTKIHDAYGLEAEAGIYLVLLTLVLLLLPDDRAMPEAVPASVSPLPGQVGVYEYSPVRLREEAALPHDLGTAPEGFEIDGRRVALASLFGGVAVASFPEVMPYLRGRSDVLAPADMIAAAGAQSRPLQVALQSGRPLLVDFSATWCADCVVMAPILEEMQKLYGDDVEFVTMDVSNWTRNSGDEDMDWWTREFRVDGIPHIAFVLPDRRVVTALIGNLPREVLVANIEALAAVSKDGTQELPQLPYVMFDAFDSGRRRVELRPDQKTREIYSSRADGDVAAITAHVATIQKELGVDGSTDAEFVKRFCQNALNCEVFRFRTLEDEFRPPTVEEGGIDLEDELQDEDSLVAWYIALRAADKFREDRQHWPGAMCGDGEKDVAGDVATLTGLASKILSSYKASVSTDAMSKMIEEVVRYGGCELHTTSSVLGGITSQEVVKLVTKQYSPLCNTLLYDGLQGKMQVLEM